jgi:hypothetical protein
LDGGEDTGELGEYAVAGGAADAAAMLCDERVGDGAVRREDRECPSSSMPIQRL